MAGKIRVAHVIPRYFPVFGGAETQCRLLVKHLPATGEVEVPFLLTGRVERQYPRTEIIDDVQVYRLGVHGVGRWQWYWFYLLSSWFLVRHRKAYDIIHCHATSTMGLAMTITGIMVRKPVVLKLSTNGELVVGLPETGRPYPLIRLRSKLRKRMASYLARHATIVALNSEGAREIETATTLRSVTIPNGIDLTHYRPLNAESRCKLRAEFGFGHDDIVLLFVGRFVARKGIRTLLDGFDQLVSKPGYARVHLCLAGGENLQEDAVHGIEGSDGKFTSGNVHILQPRIPALEYYQMADLFVFPSQREGLPNVVLEALAVGLPCVLSDIDPHIELKETNPDAIVRLFAMGDPGQLSEAVQSVLGSLDSEHADPYGPARLSETYNIIGITCKYVRLYSRLIGRSRYTPYGKRSG